jgi:hypothetical protein
LNLSSDGEPPKQKKRKTDQNFDPFASVGAFFLELARLFKSLDEFDIARIIVSEKFSLSQTLGEAIVAESRGDFAEAGQLYVKGLKEIDDFGAAEATAVDLITEGRVKVKKYHARG